MAARTYGGLTTDKVVLGLASNATLRSYAIWTKRTGVGGGSNGRMWDKRTVGVQTDVLFSSGGVTYNFSRGWTTNGEWSVPAPAASAWHHMAVTYDAGSTANLPVIYVDGAAPTLTTVSAPTGTLVTTTDPYVVGNRSNDNARNWAGDLAWFCVWDAILTAAEVAALAAGANPLTIRPGSLTRIYPLWGGTESELTGSRDAPTVTGTVVTTGPPISNLIVLPDSVRGPEIAAVPTVTAAPVVSGTPTVGLTLSTTNGTWSGTPSSYAYQWQRDNTGGGVYSNIATATSSSYLLTSSELNCNVRCLVTATNAVGASTPAASNALGPVAAAGAAPVNTVAPVISGTLKISSTLSCSTGTWTGSPTWYSYQWQRETAVGSGVYVNCDSETGPTYRVQGIDIGRRVRCVVSAHNAASP